MTVDNFLNLKVGQKKKLISNLIFQKYEGIFRILRACKKHGKWEKNSYFCL